MPLLISLLLAHAAFAPGFAAGSEVRLVSHDLLSLYAVGSVNAELQLVFDTPIQDGLAVRLVHFPPGADDVQRAAALAPGNALFGVVRAAGPDILSDLDPAVGVVSLRQFLEGAFGATLRLLVQP